MNTFSANNRSVIIEQLTTTKFDLVVIGGGITGTGIALDATSRGLKVALIEMQDFASGTSGRSTKLIHGGLRYLKQLEFKLVAEVGKEREIVHNNAAHLTKPEHMLLPIVKGGSLGKYSAMLGMTIYEWLAGVKKEEKYKFLTVEETLKTEPLLKKENLLGGILFYEYRTDDARLTIEVAKEAVNRGATILNYTKAVTFGYEDNLINKVTVQDILSHQTYDINGTCFVNASGPWVDNLCDLDNQINEHKLQITKGVHIVVDWKKIPVKQSAYFDTFDKRMLFVIPREGKTYIGTTDTFYKDDLANPNITEKDKAYIIKCSNDYFPNNQLNLNDIESGWAGLRPLVNKPGKGPSEISRKDELFISESGLITIAGGKLTGYRKMAQRVVDEVVKNKSIKTSKIILPCITQSIKIEGGKINNNILFENFIKQQLSVGLSLSLTSKEIEVLCYRYGSNITKIYDFIESIKKLNTTSELPILILAQLLYAIEYEACYTPADFFIRRTSALYFDILTVRKYKKALIIKMNSILKWPAELLIKFEIELDEELNKH